LDAPRRRGGYHGAYRGCGLADPRLGFIERARASGPDTRCRRQAVAGTGTGTGNDVGTRIYTGACTCGDA